MRCVFNFEVEISSLQIDIIDVYWNNFWKIKVAAEKSSNSVAVADTKPKVSLPKDDAKSEKNAIPDVAAISAFMGQVSDLVK